MISNSGVNSILKGSVHGTESTFSGGPSIMSSIAENRKTQTIPSLKGSFESLNSSETGNLPNTKCYLCGKRKKNICEFCLNTVCGDHSSKTRKKPDREELAKICDVCENEEAKREIKKEINEEISKLNEQLAEATKENEKLNREHFEKTSIFNKIEQQISISEKGHNKKIESMKEELRNSQVQGEKTKQMLENLKKVLENTSYNEQDMIDKCIKSENEIEVLKKKSIILKKNKEIINNEIELLNSAFKQSVSIDAISKSLCQRCSGKLTENFNRIKNTPYWLQESSEEEEKTLR
jgi:DNA repair exonuclease SbcCD ATPase subunit